MADLPTPRALETRLKGIRDDLAWLYDGKRAGPYRWLYSAIDGLQSPSGFDSGKTTGTSDLVGVSQMHEKRLVPLSQAKQAAEHVRVAQDALKAARSLLETPVSRQVESGPMCLRPSELEDLKARQQARHSRGEGFGQS